MAVFNPLSPLDHVTPKFTEEQLAEIIEWFDENSKPLLVINQAEEPTNVITIKQLQTFLGLKKFHRRAFHYPSYADIMQEVEFLHMEAHRMLIKDQFIWMLNKWVIDIDMKHELKLAFKVFDTEERDFLEIDLLQELLTTYADVLTEDEVLEFSRDANVRGDGNIFFNDFVDYLFELAPELHDVEKEYVYLDPDEDPSIPPRPPEPEPELPPPPPPPPPPEDTPPPPPPPPAPAKADAKAKGGKKKK